MDEDDDDDGDGGDDRDDTGKVRMVRVKSENELILSRRNKFFADFVQSILLG